MYGMMLKDWKRVRAHVVVVFAVAVFFCRVGVESTLRMQKMAGRKFGTADRVGVE